MYPSGLYHNSNNLDESFFTQEAQLSRNAALTDRMPFLFRLLTAKSGASDEAAESEAPAPNLAELNDKSVDPTDDLEDFDGSFIQSSRDPVVRRSIRVETVHIIILLND